MTVKISGETEKTIRGFAKHRGIEAAAALDRLVTTGYSRLTTLERFSKNAKKESKPKAPAKKGAKKAPAKKAGKKAQATAGAAAA